MKSENNSGNFVDKFINEVNKSIDSATDNKADIIFSIIKFRNRVYAISFFAIDVIGALTGVNKVDISRLQRS